MSYKAITSVHISINFIKSYINVMLLGFPDIRLVTSLLLGGVSRWKKKDEAYKKLQYY